MNENIPLPFDLPAVARKKVSAAFDGGRITSDGGVMLLTQAERRLGIADQLSRRQPASSVMMSAVMPSAKNSCSGSPLRLANGRTAMDGLSGSGSTGCAG